MLDGLRHAMKVRAFLIMLGVAFVVMAAFNGVTTWVQQIIQPRGFSSTDAGIMGGLMLVAGIIGAVVLSALSDRRGRRIPFLTLALAASVPGVLGIAFATSVWLLYVFAAVLGFFLVAALPIGMQYAAEITEPHAGGHLRRTDPAGRADLRGVRLHHVGAAHIQRLVHRVAAAVGRPAGRVRADRVASQGCGAGVGARRHRHHRGRTVARRACPGGPSATRRRLTGDGPQGRCHWRETLTLASHPRGTWYQSSFMPAQRVSVASSCAFALAAGNACGNATRSAACAWICGVTCEYTSIVMTMLRWPSCSATTLGLTPSCNASVAYVWRRSCRRIGESRLCVRLPSSVSSYSTAARALANFLPT